MEYHHIWVTELYGGNTATVRVCLQILYYLGLAIVFIGEYRPTIPPRYSRWHQIHLKPQMFHSKLPPLRLLQTGRGGFRRGRRGRGPLSLGNHSEKGQILLYANCKIKHFGFLECRKCHFRDSRMSLDVQKIPGRARAFQQLGLRPRPTAMRSTAPPLSKILDPRGYVVLGHSSCL